MSERSAHHPSDIAVGDRVQIRVGGDPIMALVEMLVPPRELRLRTPEPVTGEVLVRWLDASGMAWKATATASVIDDDLTAVSVKLTAEWQQDAMRASQRISGNRHSLRGEVQAGSLAPGSRLDLVCLDISASGCRTSGVGRMPVSGDLVRLCCVHPFGEDRWVLARVMRATHLAFGRYEIGFRFEPATADERSWLTGWRDAWAYVAHDEQATADEPEPDAEEHDYLDEPELPESEAA